MKRQVFRWVILGAAVCCLAYGLRRKHTLQGGSEESAADEQISDAELVVFATNGGVKRSGDGPLVRVLAENGEGPKACPT